MSLPETPYHTHNGVDSPKIPASSVIGLESDVSSALELLVIPCPGVVPSNLTNIGTDDSGYMIGYLYTSPTFVVASDLYGYQKATITDTFANADKIWGIIKQGDYVYVLCVDENTAPDTWQVIRYDAATLANPTTMTFDTNGLNTSNDNIRFATDGTYFYFNFDAGNSSNGWELAYFLVSGTQFIYQDTLTVGSALLGFGNSFAVTSTGIYCLVTSPARYLVAFTLAGVLDYTDDDDTQNANVQALSVIEDTLYMINATNLLYERVFYN